MDVTDTLINPPWALVCQLIFWPVFLWACWSLHGKKLDQQSLSKIWPALCVILFCLWQLKATLSLSISIHLLGATLLTVLFGWQLAVIGLTAVLIAASVISSDSWSAFGINGINTILIPVLVSYHVVKLIFRYLPRHFFIYIFLSGFANAMISLGVVGLASTAMLSITSSLEAETLIHHYLPAYLLIVFPEAFITGAVLTLFVVYRPQWVRSFDDRLYLDK